VCLHTAFAPADTKAFNQDHNNPEGKELFDADRKGQEERDKLKEVAE
jgi:hypothetical protein